MIYIFSMVSLFFTFIFTALTQIIPGGIIVPMYFSLYMKEPERLIGTICVSFLTLFLFKLLGYFFLIDKKKQLVILILISTLLTYTWWKFFPALFPGDFVFKTTGWIIAGILTNTMIKQGILKTLISCSVCTMFLFFFYSVFFIY
ncbi:MAG TPA: poly-gamma-glutamate biosynthesis protein PgsC/CapC [Thermotogota bacterium]|nr:poly-gamma-glutamate biosynthesis protein PgsC/CapC [Thermotogota bacterium]HPR96180.1 poly-gamma-glutamate biosynthesis protein PgsC/CapC [Thermotogota bacterium]